MKTILFILVGLMLLIPGVSFSQKKTIKKRANSGEAELGIGYRTLNTNNMIEFLSLNLVASVRKRIFSGGGVNFGTSLASKNNFGYKGIKPSMSTSDLYWINELRVLDKRSLKLNIVVNNGLSLIALENSHSKNVKGSVSYFGAYSVQPGLVIFLPLSNVFFKINYRFTYGKPSFGQQKDFQGFGIMIGIRGVM